MGIFLTNWFSTIAFVSRAKILLDKNVPLSSKKKKKRYWLPTYCDNMIFVSCVLCVQGVHQGILSRPMYLAETALKSQRNKQKYPQLWLHNLGRYSLKILIFSTLHFRNTWTHFFRNTGTHVFRNTTFLLFIIWSSLVFGGWYSVSKFVKK